MATQLSRWKDFESNPITKTAPVTNGALMVILTNSIRPQPIYQDILAKVKPNYEEKGYVLGEDGKLLRDGRLYLSHQMLDLEDWAKKYSLKYSFYPVAETGGAFYDEITLEVQGNITQSALDNFPLSCSFARTEDMTDEKINQSIGKRVQPGLHKHKWGSGRKRTI